MACVCSVSTALQQHAILPEGDDGCSDKHSGRTMMLDISNAGTLM